jgi:hypothetical protein
MMMAYSPICAAENSAVCAANMVMTFIMQSPVPPRSAQQSDRSQARAQQRDRQPCDQRRDYGRYEPIFAGMTPKGQDVQAEGNVLLGVRVRRSK